MDSDSVAGVAEASLYEKVLHLKMFTILPRSSARIVFGGFFSAELKYEHRSIFYALCLREEIAAPLFTSNASELITAPASFTRT